MDRVLATLRAELPGSSVTSDDRVPLRPGELPTGPAGETPAAASAEDAEELALGVQDFLERRWLTEAVPALAGLTPAEAAADPTRVEQLQRLLATFPDPAGLPPGTVTMRPERLRELLALATDGNPP